MAYTGYPFPYNISNLLVGAVRILYAPVSVALPTKISDVIDPETPYAAKTGWLEIGATTDSFTYTRGFDTEGLEIEQTAGVLFEEITDITRTIELAMAELTADTLKLIEGSASTIATIAATAGGAPVGTRSPAQKKISFGSFSTLDRYRFAFIARRNKASGIVTEAGAGTPTRGRFVMGCAYQAQMAADDAELEFAKGNLTSAGITFTMFPDDSVTLADDNYGAWFFEEPGVITA